MRTAEEQAIDLDKRYSLRLDQALLKFERVVLPKNGLFVPPDKTNAAAADLILKLEDLTKRAYGAGYKLGAKRAQADLKEQGLPLQIEIEVEEPPYDFFEVRQRTIGVIEDALLAFNQGIGGKNEINKIRSSAHACLSTHSNRAWTFAYLDFMEVFKEWLYELSATYPQLTMPLKPS